MNRPHRSPLLTPGAAIGIAAAVCLSLLAGCAQDNNKPAKIAPKYSSIAAKDVPPFMRGTIWEKVDVGNTDTYQVSAYGLVVNLDNTGDSTAPTAVREFMRKQMATHGYGSKLQPGWEHMPPERILSDKRVAIVQVVGVLPPGVRKGQTFDVIVQALPNNSTSSLAGGELYLTDLKIDGANPQNPFGAINVYAKAKGFIFVNPAYALNKEAQPSRAIQQSLRNGVIMDGAVATYDRPLFLRLRQPETRVSRYVEQRVISRFQDTTVAHAQDEGVIQLFVPESYRGDWIHFSKLVSHLYIDGSPEVLSAKAKMLVTEAQKPDAKLEDITYCWEGIGPPALPFLAPLLLDKQPEVAFSAARAAAYIGDPTGAANVALLNIARDSKNPFQLNAIETLGGLPSSGETNQLLAELLDGDDALVRIEAYKVLAHNNSPMINSRVVTPDPSNQKYVLDVVPSHGPAIVYATRTGMPRIAIIGTMPQVVTPVMFTAMNDRLTISSPDVGEPVGIFYRADASKDAGGVIHDLHVAEPVKMLSRPDIAEIVARLGGVCAEGEEPLNFSYSEVLAILQKLHDQKKLVYFSEQGTSVPASLVLEDAPAMQNVIYHAPNVDSGRPQGEDRPSASQTNDPAADAALAGNK